MHTYNTNHGQISNGDPVEVRSEGPKSYDDKYTYCICDECQFWNMQGINDPYYNLMIVIGAWTGYHPYYALNRHKAVGPDYVDMRLPTDTNNKLFMLVPVNNSKSLGKTAVAVSAKKNGKIELKWDKLRNKFKNSKIWKNAKYIEIQYSTDKSFERCVKSVKIKKGTVDKAKARTTLSKLKRKRTYYVRVRLWDNKGVYSNWSKTVKVKTKKK